MRITILIALLLPAASPFVALSQPIITIPATSNFFIASGETVSFDSLIFIPSAGFNITGAGTLTRSTTLTHPATNAFIKRVYDFSGTLPAYTGLLSIFYQPSELNSLAPASLVLNAYTTSISAWKAYSSNIGTNHVTTNTLTNLSFDEVTLSSILFPLPVTWLSASAFRQDDVIRVQWITADESGCKNYQVEKSTDGSNWSSAGTPVSALNTPGPNTYDWTDPVAVSDRTYYRILQTSDNGSTAYSIVMVVNNVPSPGALILYPNPVIGTLTVGMGPGSSRLPEKISIFDATGRLLFVRIPAGTGPYLINAGSLAAGAYTLVATLSDGSNITRTFIKK